MEKREQNRKRRSSVWSERICIKKSKKEFIKREREKKNFKTLAGTLDFIIKFYKDYVEKNN